MTGLTNEAFTAVTARIITKFWSSEVGKLLGS